MLYTYTIYILYIYYICISYIYYIYIYIYIYYIVIKEKTNNIFKVKIFRQLRLSIHNIYFNISLQILL